MEGEADYAAIDQFWRISRLGAIPGSGALAPRRPPRTDPDNYKLQCSNAGCKGVWNIEGILLGDNQTIGPSYPPELVCPTCTCRDFRIVYAPRVP